MIPEMKEKIIRLSEKTAFASLCLMIFFATFSKAAAESFFGIAFLAFVVKMFLNGKREKYALFFNKSNLPLSIFILANIFSLINSGPFLTKSLQALFFKWLEYIAIYFIVVDTANTQKRTNIILVVLLFSLGMIGVDGIFQRITGIDFLRFKGLAMVQQNQIPAITASFNFYNDLAGYLLIVLPLLICLYLFKRPVSKLIRIVFLGEMILIILCLLLTFSRGGWFGFLIALIFMLIFSPKGKLSIFVLILLFASIISFPLISRGRVLITFADYGDAQRFRLWRNTIAMIKDNPVLGKGVGTFMDNLPKYDIDPGAQYAHNCFLQIWAEAGFFALWGFLWFVALLFYNGLKVIRGKGNFMLLGILTGIFGFLVHSFFDTHLYSLQLSILFWFMAGYAVAITRFEVKDTDNL